MGIIPTVSKKTESQQPSSANGDDKKLLANLNNGIDELKTQNLENAKFLRGISRKIENELSQMREIEEGKALEMFDETAILESLERIENLINTDNITEELSKMNNTLLGFNADVIYMEIEKVNRSLKQINSDNIMLEIDNVNENVSRLNTDNIMLGIDNVNKNVSRLNTDNIMSGLNRLEAIVSEINSNAVLAELGRLRMLITEKDNGKAFETLGLKLDMISKQNNANQSNANQLEEIKNLLLQNAQQVENMQAKLERISTMPVMLKSIIQSENENNLRRIDDRLTDLNQQQDNKMSGLKTIIGFNLWLSLLAVVLIIVNILGII